ncbi:hypothetical protein NBW16_14755 [Brucella abortus]|nr:hypothetical protein NBW16_14755 [Brucella abortus]
MRKSYKRVPVIRRSHAMWMSPRVWKPRLVFWCGALAIGIISVGFAEAADIAQDWFHSLTSGSPLRAWLPLLITPRLYVLLVGRPGLVSQFRRQRHSTGHRGTAFERS